MGNVPNIDIRTDISAPKCLEQTIYPRPLPNLPLALVEWIYKWSGPTLDRDLLDISCGTTQIIDAFRPLFSNLHTIDLFTNSATGRYKLGRNIYSYCAGAEVATAWHWPTVALVIIYKSFHLMDGPKILANLATTIPKDAMVIIINDRDLWESSEPWKSRVARKPKVPSLRP